MFVTGRDKSYFSVVRAKERFLLSSRQLRGMLMFVTGRDKSYFSVVRAKERKQVLMRLVKDLDDS
jgi:hypothetical protein